MAKADATRALLKTRYRHSDEYVGTADQLCACGLVRPGQFPGQPGVGKVAATYFLADGQPARSGHSALEPTYVLHRLGSTRYSVRVAVCDQEEKRRGAFNYVKGTLPLNLPGTQLCEALEGPSWAPAGFVFRCRRERSNVDDYVFNASVEDLRASNLMDGQPLPGIEDARHKTVQLRSPRFGHIIVAQRAAQTFIVTLQAPSEIRNADYEARDCDWGALHYGTKRQLQERGLGVGIGFPGEPGCNRRQLTALAPNGKSAMRVELLHRSDWHGEVPRYMLSVDRTEAELESLKKVKRDADNEQLRLQTLKSMPATPEKFRDAVADIFWAGVSVAKAHMQAKDGYRFAPDVVDEFIETVTDVYWTLKEGETIGCSPRNKLQQVLCANAKADAPLQRFLSGLRPNDAH